MSEFINENDSEEFFFTIGEIKTKQGFATVIKRALEKAFPYTHIVVTPRTKNNGLHLLGLTICDMEHNMSPTFYLDSFFQDYKHGCSLENICNHIINLYEENKPFDDFPIEVYTAFENVKDRICYKLINFQANRVTLESKPFIPYLDLAIVFYIPVEVNDLSGTIDITNTLMKSWNISSAFGLFEYAHDNTERIRGLRYGTMQDLMKSVLPKEIVPDELQALLDESLPPTYVATTTDKLQGACCILYENAMEKFADMIGGSFYILPSSLHEIIMLPSDAETNPILLAQMVREVNATSIDANEVLSDHVYFYDEVRNKLTICRERE